MAKQKRFGAYIGLQSSEECSMAFTPSLPSLTLVHEWKKGDRMPLGKIRDRNGALFALCEGSNPVRLIANLEESLRRCGPDLERLDREEVIWACEIVTYLNPCDSLCECVEVPNSLVRLIAVLGGTLEFFVYICNDTEPNSARP
jgi:hypothetical protein